MNGSDSPGSKADDRDVGGDGDSRSRAGDEPGRDGSSGNSEPTGAVGAGPRGNRPRRILTWVLAVALVLAAVGVVFVSLTPQRTTDPFTEFYLLGPEGNASGYPTDLTPGGSGDVVVGVTNHEGVETDYRVVVTWNGSETERRDLTVPDGETRELRLTLTAPEDPGLYRVRFLLYKRNGSGRVYEFLRLWITVEPGTSNATGRPVDPG